jgi:hypothetical protein
MNEYFKRPQDVVNAVRFLGRLGLSVSSPNMRTNGEMFFKIEGQELSVVQILELVDNDKLNPMTIRQFAAQRHVRAAGCGM